MYTLTRKLSVVCLTVVLSFLVYGCGGSSKQALITDVSTEMVTAGLTPDAGTYTIQPGGTATAGDVTFACPEEGSSCEVTVADDGTVTSTGGMATAMTSASAAARLAAIEAARVAEEERDAANAAAMLAEELRLAAEAAAMLSEEERDAANEAARLAEEARDAAEEVARLAEEARDAAEEVARLAGIAQAAAETERDAANEAARLAAIAQDTANEAARLAAIAQAAAETERDAANEAARLAAIAQAAAETERDAANEAARLAAIAQDTAETERDAANEAARLAAIAQDTAETERDAANEAARLAAIAQDTAESERDAANVAAMLAAGMRDDALAALTIANRRANAKSVDRSDLDKNYMTIMPGIYTIEPGDNMDVDDVNFACPADGPACEVIVAADEDGDTTVVSGDGVATIQHSMAAMNTMTAIELAAADALGTQEAASATGAPATVGVSRSPSGVTTIELTHVADATDEVEYASEAVDTGHEIAGWMGQTLKRDDSEAADTEADTDAVPAEEMDEATFYTNIDPAKPGKLKEVPETGVVEIAVDADLMLDGLTDEDDTFRAELIRTDGTRIPGTFTCDADSCGAVTTDAELVLGVTVLSANPGTGWEFESDDNVKEGETPDADYMYFGYWLKSPVGDGTTDYAFATFSGGSNANNFVSDNRTLYDSANLTATYEGGAAGMYVSRELRLVNGLVDVHSPGTYGRFTAKAELEANFGTHDPLDDGTAVTNTIHGTISEFRDGDTDLGFEVTLGRSGITQGTGVVDGTGNTTAMFGDNGPGTGDWSAQLFGPAVDSDSTARQMNAFPTGVAGRFDAVTTNTGATTQSRVVGAFAAEEK